MFVTNYLIVVLHDCKVQNGQRSNIYIETVRKTDKLTNIYISREKWRERLKVREGSRKDIKSLFYVFIFSFLLLIRAFVFIFILFCLSFYEQVLRICFRKSQQKYESLHNFVLSMDRKSPMRRRRLPLGKVSRDCHIEAFCSSSMSPE